MLLNNFAAGEKFVNPLTKKIATITKVEPNHYYKRDGITGNYYHLEYENGNKIELTPIMISRFQRYESK